MLLLILALLWAYFVFISPDEKVVSYIKLAYFIVLLITVLLKL